MALLPIERGERERGLGAVRRALDESAFAAQHAAGRALSITELGRALSQSAP